MPVGAYVPVGNRPEGGCRPGAVALHEYIIERWGAGVGSFGCYNPNSRAGNGWSLHREGRAIDVSIASSARSKGNEIFEWAIRNADQLGLQEIQWSGRIWTSRRSQEGIREDTSPAGALHYDHVHIGLASGYTFDPPDSDVPSVDWDVIRAVLAYQTIRRQQAMSGMIAIPWRVAGRPADSNDVFSQHGDRIKHVWPGGQEWLDENQDLRKAGDFLGIPFPAVESFTATLDGPTMKVYLTDPAGQVYGMAVSNVSGPWSFAPQG